MSVKTVIDKLIGFLERGFKHVPEGQHHGGWKSADASHVCIMGTVANGIGGENMGFCSCGTSETNVALNYIKYSFPELFEAQADPHCPICKVHISKMAIRGDAISKENVRPLPMVAMHLNDDHGMTYSQIVDKLKDMLVAKTGETVDKEMEDRIRKLVHTPAKQREKV